MSRPGGGTTACIVSLLSEVTEKRRLYHEDMNCELESSETWLADVIETCKRKILEPAGLERQQKKAKTHAPVEDKENSNPNLPENEANENAKDDAHPDDAHPDDDIDIMSLKVAELRQELRKRGLDTAGLKKDLQKRLTAAIDDAKAERETKRREAALPQKTATSKPEEVSGTKEENAAVDQAKNVSEDETNKHLESGMNIEGRMDPQSKAEDAMDVEVQNDSKAEEVEVEVDAAVVSSDEQSDSLCPADVVMDDAANTEEHSSEVNEKDLLEKTTVSAVPLSKRVTMEMSTEQAEFASAQQINVSSKTTQSDSASATGFSEASSTDDISPKKKGLGKKLIKATSKLFSPSKKKSPVKEMRSPPLTEITKNHQNDQDQMEVIDEGHSLLYDESDSVVLPQDLKEQTTEEKSQMIASSPAAIQIDQVKRSSQLSTASSCSNASKRAEEKMKIKMALKNSGNPKPPSSAKSSSSIATPANLTEGCTSLSSTGGKSSAQAKKMALSKARLDEIRGKSKPVALSKSTRDKLATANTSESKKGTSNSKLMNTSTSMSSTLAKNRINTLKTGSKTATDDKDAKQAQLRAQMREKARMNTAAVPTLNKKASQLSNPQPSRPIPKPGQEPSQPHKSAQLPVQLPKSAQKPVQAPKSAQKPVQPQHFSLSEKQNEYKQAKPMSPMDTYEISDREDSDSDESDYSDYEDNKPNKKIPKWAQRSNLIAALEKQFAIGERRIDPDHIFPEVQTCNLEEIFDQKKARYKKRTSSGNWTQDRVTAKEKLVYKRQMGYQSK